LFPDRTAPRNSKTEGAVTKPHRLGVQLAMMDSNKKQWKKEGTGGAFPHFIILKAPKLRRIITREEQRKKIAKERRESENE